MPTRMNGLRSKTPWIWGRHQLRKLRQHGKGTAIRCLRIASRPVPFTGAASLDCGRAGVRTGPATLLESRSEYDAFTRLAWTHPRLVLGLF